MSMIRLVALGAAVVIGGCGSDPYGSGGSGCTPTATQVCMTASTFNPVSRTVTAGMTVMWRNGSSLDHTVTNDAGSAEVFNQSVGPSGTFSHQFNTADTFGYHCNIHPGMTGTIVVNP